MFAKNIEAAVNPVKKCIVGDKGGRKGFGGRALNNLFRTVTSTLAINLTDTFFTD